MTEHSQCRITIQNLYKSYSTAPDQQTQVLEDINLDIHAGDFVSVIGHAGCGKSTLLRLLKGLEQHQQGQILIQGKQPAEHLPNLSIVYQDHRLFNWLSVTENIRMALHQIPLSKEEENRRIQEQLELLQLKPFKDAYPSHLSAGMNLKVAIAKSLVTQPDILLLDDPFAGLDALMRHHLHEELQRIWKAKKITVILATQDIAEALLLSTSVVVMQANPGRIEQVLKVSLSYPRKRQNTRLQQLKKEILKVLNFSIVKDQQLLLTSSGQFCW
ncbi:MULTISPECIES: ABC transporter ATP-binding protein [unclassified Acinetobacter]|uniref:ABC transporter ATP-binding protein n=1 Tax=unclassified Acinetobacter TaxID=196816 RepID=UPI0015D31134|nr:MULTISPECIES: ABC transporter ATP-binding protein [unclassified Acinetobacter]